MTENYLKMLNEAGESKRGLLDFLLEQGYPKYGHHYSTLNHLIQSSKDLNMFYSVFDGDWDSSPLMFSIARLKQYKIDQSRLSWEDFEDIFSFDRQDALQTLFQSKCPQWEIDKLDQKFEQGLTLRHIYDTALTKHPEGYNFLWGYVNRNWGEFCRFNAVV